MSKEESIKILKECDAGVKTAVSSISEVIDRAETAEMHTVLQDSLKEHEEIGYDIEKMLFDAGADGKEPNPMAKAMSWSKINAKMMGDESDATIAGLMIDGCNMGIKNVSKYVNQYPTAEQAARNAADRLVKTEQDFMDRLRVFL